MDRNPSASLAQQLEELRARVRRLEEALHRQGIALPPDTAQDSAAPAAASPAATAGPAAAAPLASASMEGRAVPSGAPVIPAAPAAAPSDAGVRRADRPSLESRIGSQWFNRVGILAVLVGAAWFLKLAIDNHWIGPLERVVIGLLAGIGALLWAERFRRSGYPGFGSSLHATGSGILYLSLWAAFSLFHLFPGPVAFAAMVAVTALNGYLSWAREAELLAFYSLAGGLATPLLLSNGINHEAALFTYLLLLDTAVLLLVAVRPWPRLLGAAFAGTVFFFTGWWWQYYSSAQSGRTAFFLACFFLIFAAAPRLFPLDGERSTSAAAAANRTARLRWKNPVLVLLPVANAGLGFLGFYGIVSSSHAAWAAPWLACAFALFYLSLYRFLRGGGPAELPPLHLAAAIVFLTIAIPLWSHGRWMTIGWLAEGAALLGASARVRIAVLRVLAVCCLTLGLIALVAIYPPAAPTLLLNQRFAAFCVGIALFAAVAWMSSARRQQQSVPAALSWSRLAVGAAIVSNLLVLLAIGWEIHSYWARAGVLGPMHEAHINAQFTYSAFFMLFGGLLLAAGFFRRSAFLRWQALVLLAATIAKVFLVDVSELSQGYRILSFLGLGALLLAVSFLYQRDWLGLRGTGRRRE